MGYLTLKKNFFNDFIAQLSKISKVVAPVSKGFNRYEFTEVHSGKEISMEYIPTILPPKKYFAPQHETLIEYNTTERQKMEAVVDYEPLILFGVHTCDLAGIQCLNIVFSDRPKDLHYQVRKNHIVLIGFECNFYCDEYASCALMGNHLPNGGYDLFFTDLGDYYLVHVQTQTGDDIAQDELQRLPGRHALLLYGSTYHSTRPAFGTFRYTEE